MFRIKIRIAWKKNIPRHLVTCRFNGCGYRANSVGNRKKKTGHFYSYSYTVIVCDFVPGHTGTTTLNITNRSFKHPTRI